MDEALTEAPIEEHFVIRFPPGLANALRDPIRNRNVPVDLEIKQDARSGKLTFKNKTYNTTLVDLPCITESLKTIDNKQFYKIADVSQMLIVHEGRYSGPKDYAWPDGLTTPLKDVRNRRFRKRMSKKVIEDVEAEVERLLTADLEAEDVRYEVHERKEQDEDEDEELSGQMGESDGEDDDLDLAAAIDEALDKDEVEANAQDAPDESEEEEEESGEESEEPEEEQDVDENNELKNQMNTLKHEIQALEAKLAEKNQLAQNQVNEIMKERFKGIVNKLSMELVLKREQLEKLEVEIRNEEEDQ
ncbi:hypothetical protein HK103_002936 [Boothiomyces macroporosus]|uniref:TAFII55 protein conserved region domain-containing protein n=1 Tax=Boothiomyces macroporosus TaxID=261099 RepID=A0AAD5Y2E2_9FUNG|nr:hypothetical protein HK103_002936 [Boothiomyces macroporosus]